MNNSDCEGDLGYNEEAQPSLAPQHLKFHQEENPDGAPEENETPNNQELEDVPGDGSLEGVNVDDTNFKVRRSIGGSNGATPSNRAILPGGGSRRNVNGGLVQYSDPYDPESQMQQMYVQQQSSYERKQRQ